MQHINSKKLSEWESQGISFQLIDVRTAEEHFAKNIGGELIPLDELMNRTGEISLDRPVVFYCRKGIRSQLAIQKLEAKGIMGNFYNLEGGIG